ncbi:MAG: glycosyltransferase family 2 protein [Ignavibacteriae bacterium]|nr:MAG: glycosyltransferase family 2 protein [Ignavibacteriota bacterium]
MISIVIPNYNGLEHLKTCYPSLLNQSYKDWKLVLVDNGSTDDSISYTMQTIPDTHIIPLKYNFGFAKAVNEGIKDSIYILKPEYILLLNNDIELAPDFLEKGIKTFKLHEDVSSVAVKMLNYYDRNIIDDCGDFIKAHGGSPFARGHGEKDSGQYDKPEYIFGACAGAAFYRKEVFDKAGFFDEDFFAYYEDIDFSFRMQLFGLKCFYQPKAVCYHKRGGTSSVATHGFQTEMCERNLIIMRAKNYPLSLYILYQPLFFIARMNRYYSFIRFHSFTIFLRALRGYFRGIGLYIFQIRKRNSIQKRITVPAAYIKGLFTK